MHWVTDGLRLDGGIIIDYFHFNKLELLTPFKLYLARQVRLILKKKKQKENRVASPNGCEEKRGEVNEALTCLRLTLNPTPPLLQHRQVRSSRTKETSPEQEMRMTT